MAIVLPQRENPNRPLRSASPKAQVPSSPSEELGSPTSEAPPVAGRRPGFFARNSGRSSPQKQVYPPPSTSGEMNEVEEGDVVPSDNGTGFVLVESPSSKARAIRALKREQAAREATMDEKVENLATPEEEKSYAPPTMNRVKGLPTPPIAPVMPDFNDMVGQRQRGLSVSDGAGGEGAGVRRKTSMVKKLKDRMAK